MSYGQSIREAYARTPVSAERILKGANPGGLRVEQPTGLALAGKVATPKSLGIAVPNELLLRADTLIRYGRDGGMYSPGTLAFALAFADEAIV